MTDDPGRQRGAASRWPLIARFAAAEARTANAIAAKGPVGVFVYEFVRFGVKQAWACLFGGLMLALLLATWLWYPKGAMLARYDALTLAALGIQVFMVASRLETWEEARIIAIFHVVGTIMEIFKTAVGSWIYPEPSVLRIAGVPLFTGFMYAAVGSYMARCWRVFDFRFDGHPPVWALALLSVAIYVNFFAHHYVVDMRLALFLAAAILIGPCTIHYRIWEKHRRMPLLLGLVLVAIFIWIAENIGTFAGAWVYPAQRAGWKPVGVEKLGSWFLLMLLSYTLVASIARPRPLATCAAAGASSGGGHLHRAHSGDLEPERVADRDR